MPHPFPLHRAMSLFAQTTEYMSTFFRRRFLPECVYYRCGPSSVNAKNNQTFVGGAGAPAIDANSFDNNHYNCFILWTVATRANVSPTNDAMLELRTRVSSTTYLPVQIHSDSMCKCLHDLHC